MHRPVIGFVTCVHPLYDLPAVAGWREEAAGELGKCGCEVILCDVPRTPAQAIALAAELAGREVDLVVLFFCSWVSEEVTLALARAIGTAPLLLWALPYLDRDIPMPSPMSGLTGSGSNIRRMGKPFVHLIGGVARSTVDQVAGAARSAAAVGALRRARLGVVGEPCPGMVDVAVDDADLQNALGVTIVHFELDELLQAAQSASQPEADQAASRLIAGSGARNEIGEQPLADNLRLYVAMREMAAANRLDAYCVRCWPELRDHHRITLCTTHALMAEDGVPNTCEVDLPALVTTYLLHKLAGKPAFNFDITAYLAEEGAVQFAHCGAAAPSLAGDPNQVRLRVHMRTGTGATVEFPFPEGTATLAKLLRPSGGKWRLFVARGEVIESCGVRGSVATVKPEPDAGAFLDKMMYEAVEHHVALVYGDWTAELKHFCQFTGVEYVA